MHNMELVKRYRQEERRLRGAYRRLKPRWTDRQGRTFGNAAVALHALAVVRFERRRRGWGPTETTLNLWQPQIDCLCRWATEGGSSDGNL
jgi:hypothetical protein